MIYYNRFKNIVLKITKAVFVASLVAISSTASAWNDPGIDPPNDNAEPPINVSGDPQKKTGDLNIGGGLDYWITKDGDSFSLKNNNGVDKFIVGQDGNIIVNGQIKITGGTPGLNKLLVSDANGLASWKTAADAGIAGSLPAGILGQTLRHNGTAWIEDSTIYNNGTNVGIGTVAPGAKLEVAGQIKITGGTPGLNKLLVSDAAGLATWKTAADLGIGGTMPVGASGQTLRHDGTAWIGNFAIYNNGANVGIGTMTPGAKLEVAGQIKITGGNPGSNKLLASDASGLASWVDPPASLKASTCSVGTMVLGADSNGNLICGWQGESGACQSGEYVKGIDSSGKIICDAFPSLCSASTCSSLSYTCGSWPDGCGNTINCGTCTAPNICAAGTCAVACTPGTCASLGYTCGNQSDGCGGTLSCGTCASDKTCTLGTCKDADCRGNSLGGKRIFVTSAGYSGNQVQNDAAADTLCQTHATTAGLPGTYKALIYLGNRMPETVLPLGFGFYNGRYTGSYCDWKLVAGSRALMWSLPLTNPIRYDEFGNDSVLTSVWTNFKSLGSGTYKVIDYCRYTEHIFPCTDSWPCAYTALQDDVYYEFYWACARNYYGTPTSTSVNWGGNLYEKESAYESQVTPSACCTLHKAAVFNTCQAFQRALYCVEQ